MRVVELAPKFKNYSQTKTLDYRVQMVVGHHNTTMYEFYSRIFEILDISMSENLAFVLQSRDRRKIRKKEHDTDVENQRRRRWKWEAKDKEALLKEASCGPKEGTYETGVAVKRKEGSEGKTPRPKRTLIPCDCGRTKSHYYRSSKYCLKDKKEQCKTSKDNDKTS